MLEFRCGWVGVVTVLQAEACNTVTSVLSSSSDTNIDIVLEDLLNFGPTERAAVSFWSRDNE